MVPWWWQWRWWVEGSRHGGGLVVSGLLGYFLMGLWLDICWVCGGFGVMVVVVWW